CTFADNGTYPVRARIIDKDDGFTEYTTTVTVDNANPVVVAPANQASDEGTSTSFDLGSFTDAGVNDNPWAIDVNWGDGTPHHMDNKSSQDLPGNASHKYDDNGSYTVRARIIDKDGGYSEYTTNVVVTNVAPSLTQPVDDSALEGTSKSFGLGSFSDPGANDAPWDLHVTWGDGSPATDLPYSSRGALGMAPHAYDDNGVYTVTETITDKDGGSDSQTYKVTVANVAPTADLSNTGPADEG